MKSWEQRLNKRRKQGPSKWEALRGPNSHTWPKVIGGMRRPAQNDGWARGYDGPGKGTW